MPTHQPEPVVVRFPASTRERLAAVAWVPTDPSGLGSPEWLFTTSHEQPAVDDPTWTPGIFDGSFGAGQINVLSPTFGDPAATLPLAPGAYNVWCRVTVSAAERPMRQTHRLIVT